MIPPPQPASRPPKDYAYTSGERQVATTYDAIRHDHRARYDLAVEVLTRRSLGGPDAWGLDLFCGNGYGTARVAARTATPLLGIDGSAEAIAVAEQAFPTPGTLFVHKRFPFALPRGRFDFALCFESLEHVEDDAGLLAALTNALRPGGLLFVSVPNQATLPLTEMHSTFHVRHYQPAAIAALLDAAGIVVEECHGQDSYRMADGRVQGILPEDAMGLRRDHAAGQFLVFVGHKRA